MFAGAEEANGVYFDFKIVPRKSSTLEQSFIKSHNHLANFYFILIEHYVLITVCRTMYQSRIALIIF